MKRTRRQALGQHFLRDRSVLKKIVRRIQPTKDDLVIEIGAGKGVLTFQLIKEAGKVIAIEKDKRLAAQIQAKTILNLKVVEEDVLRIDFHELLWQENYPADNVKLAGNLPYSISSPILFRVLENMDLFPYCVFLLQKEVGERLCAIPGTKKYAPLSILFQLNFETRLHIVIPPECFSPPPRVKSVLVSLKRREQPLYPVEDLASFQQFLRKSFQHRRKTLLNNLKGQRLPLPLIQEAFQKTGLRKNARPEEAAISQFVELFHFFQAATRT